MHLQYFCLSAVGYRTFIGYMYMEVTNNHPVVRAFIALLQESSQGTLPRPPPVSPSEHNTSTGSPSEDNTSTGSPSEHNTSTGSPNREQTNGLHHRQTSGRNGEN